MGMRKAAGTAETISAAQAAGMVRSGMWLDYCGAVSQPDVFDHALAARRDELENVKIRATLSLRPRAVLEADPEGRHFYMFNMHFSGYDRKKQDLGRMNYIPVNLGEIPDYYRRFIDPVDIVVVKCCRMDEQGYFNFSVANIWHRDIIERARLVIVEVTDGNSYAFGEANGIHVSEVDYIIEGDHQLPPELPNPPPTDVDRAVGRQIVAEIDDGSCLQIGIGGMPNSVCSLLLESHARDLGVHTEMLTDGLVALHDAGLITGSRKVLYPGKMSYTFAVGSRHLYNTLHRNPDYWCCPVEATNLPAAIMQNDRVVSINNTNQMDLQGQACSESDGFRHISGTGGQLQFVRGAYASRGGKSFICLSSTYERHGQRKSRIVLELTPGNVVTVPRTDIMYVVTEFGMVNLKGKSIAERALAMISLAHPDFREDLERQAYEKRLIPRGVRF